MNLKITPNGHIYYQRYDGEPWVHVHMISTGMENMIGTGREIVFRGAERKNCNDCLYFKAVEEYKCVSCMWNYEDMFRKNPKVVR